MLTELWGIYGVKFHTANTSASTLGAIMRQSVGIATNVMTEPTSGEPYSRWASIVGQSFNSGFVTRQIATALGLTGLQCLDITADGSHAGLVLYGQKQANKSSRASGSVHRSFTVSSGLVCPTRLSCDHQGDAELEYAVSPIYDGTNPPVYPTDSVALPTAPTDGERFTLGNVTLGGISFDGFTRIGIELGQRVVTKGAESNVWDTHVHVESVVPKITISGPHVRWWSDSAIPTTGLACTQANSKIYLRKRKANTTFEADNQTVHYRFNMAGLATMQGGFDASGNSEGEVSLTVDCIYDGTNNPLVGTPNVAIT